MKKIILSLIIIVLLNNFVSANLSKHVSNQLKPERWLVEKPLHLKINEDTKVFFEGKPCSIKSIPSGSYLEKVEYDKDFTIKEMYFRTKP